MTESALQHEIATLKADIAKLQEDLKAAAGTGAEALGDRAREAGESLKEKIAEKPLEAVAIALGAGVLLGLLLRK